MNGNPTIYVVGTDGHLHGFSTPGQYLGDGYDAALVVTVPTLGGLTVGSSAGVAGSAVTALATRADGAIVDSSGRYYVFAGGKAFGIPTHAELLAVREGDTAKVLPGSVGLAQTGAAIANGTLLSTSGLVYVSYGGSVYPFKSMAQLSNDGYSGTAAVPAPGIGSLSIVSPYSGS